MNNDTAIPKPIHPEQPSPKGLDDATCSDSLSPLEWLRLKEWFLDYLCQDISQKPAITAFTASAARDAATAFESAVFEFNGRRIGDPNAKCAATGSERKDHE